MQDANDREAQDNKLLDWEADANDSAPGLKVSLSVREKWGGPIKRLSLSDRAIGQFDAKMQAVKKASKAGYQPPVAVIVGCVEEELPFAIVDLASTS